MVKLTDEQLDTLADVYEHLMGLARANKQRTPKRRLPFPRRIPKRRVKR